MNIRNTTVAVLALILSACASEPASDMAVVDNLQTVTAQVEAIDHKTRMVTLKNADGEAVTFKASEEVRNLPQVQVGDTVSVNYYTALAAQIKPKGSTQSSEVQYDVGGTRAALGSRPGVMAGDAITVDVRIESVDLKANKVRFTGPAGLIRETDVEDPQFRELLKSLKVGDIVEITYFEGIAASVDPVSTPAAPEAAK
ncbi:MAG: hypothetical protein WBJ03_01160 [Moraxellaceae bacterium]